MEHALMGEAAEPPCRLQAQLQPHSTHTFQPHSTTATDALKTDVHRKSKSQTKSVWCTNCPQLHGCFQKAATKVYTVTQHTS